MCKSDAHWHPHPDRHWQTDACSLLLHADACNIHLVESLVLHQLHREAVTGWTVTLKESTGITHTHNSLFPPLLSTALTGVGMATFHLLFITVWQPIKHEPWPWRGSDNKSAVRQCECRVCVHVSVLGDLQRWTLTSPCLVEQRPLTWDCLTFFSQFRWSAAFSISPTCLVLVPLYIIWQHFSVSSVPARFKWHLLL